MNMNMSLNKHVQKTNIALIVCVAASLAWGGSISQAFDGFGGYAGYAFPWFGYGNNGPAAYALGNIPAPPYFALHPPVYYSHPTPRTYGHSPFAAPCDCHARRTVANVVVNPHIQAVPAKPAAAEGKPVTVAAVPLRLVNPFYEATVLASDQE